MHRSGAYKDLQGNKRLPRIETSGLFQNVRSLKSDKNKIDFGHKV